MPWSLTWKPPSNRPDFDILHEFVNELSLVIDRQSADIADLFPFRNASYSQIHLGDGWLGFKMEFALSPGIPSVEVLDGGPQAQFHKLFLSNPTPTFEEMLAALGSEHFGFSKFSYLGPWRDQMMSWDHLMSNAIAWLNSQVLPEVLRRNRARHHRAAPPPPRLDVSALTSSLWILECEQSNRQGTAFALEGVGLVTCEHVLGPETHAFQTTSPNDKRRINVLARNAAIDLATISIDTALPTRLPRGSADSLRTGDPVTV